ncbi:MAG: hypothetical protein ACI8X5_004264 [Planctomycetota bacterium]
MQNELEEHPQYTTQRPTEPSGRAADSRKSKMTSAVVKNSQAAQTEEPSKVSPLLRRVGLRRVGQIFTPARLLMAAVGVVVALVTLPLLRSLALKENEIDALRALDFLGREVYAAENSALTVGDLVESGELAIRMPDTRLLEGGRVMFHHGYLFDLVPTEDGGRVLRAWPWAHGKTGLGAFWCDAPGILHGHPNSRAMWSGEASAPNPSTQGWRPVAIPAGRNPRM